MASKYSQTNGSHDVGGGIFRDSNMNMAKDKAKDEPKTEKKSGNISDTTAADNCNSSIKEVASLKDLEERKVQEGHAKFKRLGWKRLTVVLIVEAIALGSLSLPSAFATLGMVAGVFLSVGLGLIAIYTSHIVGQVKLRFPEVQHYADAGRLICGRFGYELLGAMFTLQLVFLVGSHCLTGTIAFQNITENGACGIVFGVVSAVILLLLAIPPSFAELAILGYIDFASILLAIGITIIATGVQAGRSSGGMSSVDWSAWPKEGATLVDAVIAVTNIVFAYSFAITQFSMME